MINATPCKIVKTLIALHESKIRFYPCGSRFFRDATDSSDWDFFTDDPIAPAELKLMGFVEVTHKLKEHRDINMLAVWIRGQKVQVIVVRSSEMRLEAQTYFVGKPKSVRKGRHPWNKQYEKLGLA